MKKNFKLKAFSVLVTFVLLISTVGIFDTYAAAPTYSGGMGTKDDPYILSTVSDLVAFREAIENDDGSLDAVDECGLGMYHGYYFELANDIDMADVEWAAVSFCGNLDGNGHSIKNLSVSASDNGDGEYWAAMFAQLINATITNITFENCSATIADTVTSERDFYAAIVAANSIASKLENVHVVDSTVELMGTYVNFAYAAGLVAWSDITNFTSCTVTGGSVINGAIAPGSNDTFAAGITGNFGDMYYEFIASDNPYNMAIGAGSDYGIYNCYVNTEIVSSGESGRYASGIVSRIETEFWDKVNSTGIACEIIGCIFDGSISAETGKATGILGKDEFIDDVNVIRNCMILTDDITAPETFPITEEVGTLENTYYLADTEDGNGGITADKLASGEICDELGKHYFHAEECVICGESVPTYYDISVNDTDGGDVIAEPASAMAGDEVTLKITPKNGYSINTVKYNDGTKDHVVTANNGVYSFIMPEGAVTISVSYTLKAVVSIEKTSSVGLVDTYTITYTDGSTTDFTITNGKDGETGTSGATGAAGKDGMTPKLRINADTNMWEVSYDDGATWTSLGVKATGEKGEKGDKGDTGAQGPQGAQGATGATGKDGMTPKLRINAETNEWEVSYDDGATWTSLGVKATGEKGAKGAKGDKGDKGDTGAQGAAGKDGINGTNGANGKDGANGADGKDGINGIDGKNGADGSTPYVGENGNWWIDGSDTGIKAKAANGAVVASVAVASVALLGNIALICLYLLKRKK